MQEFGQPEEKKMMWMFLGIAQIDCPPFDLEMFTALTHLKRSVKSH